MIKIKVMKTLDDKTLKIIIAGINLYFAITKEQGEPLESVEYETPKDGVTRRQFVFHFNTCDLSTFYENDKLIYFERRFKNE